ncbi:MAG: membrane dipeptidase [Phycisphaerae bacterium]|nr:membrane dipeptidase [Phycisphaerae bacterium]
MKDTSSLQESEWVDGHLDIAYLAESGRDCTVRCPDPDQGCLSFPDLHDAPVRIALATIFTEAKAPGQPAGYIDSADVEGASAAGRCQLAWYQSMESRGFVTIIRSRADLDRALVVPRDRAPLAVVLLMECADPMRSPDEVSWWFEQGVRVVGLSWAYGSRYSGGNSAGGGITPLGRDLVAAFDALGILHDVSHLSDASFDDLLALTTRRVVATHSNCRALLPPKERHLTDTQINAIGARDGLVGLNLFGLFLASEREATIEDCMRHVEHVAGLIGPERTGLGSDLDGGFTPKQLPIGLRHPRDYRVLAEGLGARSWSAAHIAGFRAANWLRILRSTLQ